MERTKKIFAIVGAICMNYYLFCKAIWNGRISRRAFWPAWIVMGALSALPYVGWICAPVLPIMLCLAVARSHDVGMHPLWCLLLAVPIVNLVFVLTTFTRKSVGPNEWGESPYKSLREVFDSLDENKNSD